MAEKSVNTTVLDYLKWRGDLSFAADPFNEVDNLVLCVIAYLNFSRFPQLHTKEPERAMRLSDLAAQMDERDDQLGLSELSYLPVMFAAARTARFGGVGLFGYENELSEGQESQFQAISFLLPEGSVFSAFMGTDLSLAGWKENFNMSYLDAVPAQKRAAGYVSEIAAICNKPFRIGGHSKGGNLAAWAAMHLPQEQQERLLDAYNNDGPGFSRDLLTSETYQRVAQKLHTYIPESSIVGVLLEHAADYTVIDSVNRGVLQHEILSWRCEGNHFVHLGQRSQLGQASDEVLREWIGSLTPQEREDFSDTFFAILSEDGKYRTIDELKEGGISGRWELLKRFSAADEEEKKLLADVFKRLVDEIRSEVRRDTRENLRSAKDSLKAAVDAITEKRK